MIGTTAANIKSCTIHKKAKVIAAAAFEGNTCLESVTIPESVTTIGDSAFSFCIKLKNITIPKSVTKIGDYMFSDCASLTSINIPNDVNYIGYSSFHNCSKLTSITIPNKVAEIGPSAFQNCRELKKVNIPDSVTSIGNSAFAGCTSLKTVSIGKGTTNISSVFTGCSSLTSVTFGGNVNFIGNDAFSYCSSLTSITIPDSVTNIGSNSFSGCTSLKSIAIPDSVTNIGDYAFSGCKNLSKITFSGSVPYMMGLWFLEDVTAKAYYPKSNNTWTKDVLQDYGGNITWIAYNPLQIETQPKNAYAVIGDIVKTSVKASGDGLKYEWYIKNAGASKYSKSSNTTATYSCKMNSTTSGRYIKCKITDRYGNSIWTKVVLLKSKAFAITKQPVSKTVKTGTTAKFSVTPNSANVSYQWQYRTSSTSSWKNASATGNKTATLSVPATFSRYGYQYRCKITHSTGNVIYTNAVTLRATGIKTQPVNKAVVAGKTTTFTVSAAGPSLKYQWQYRSSSSGKWSSAKADGNTTATLSIPATCGRNGYQYRCKIKDSAGNVIYTKAVILYVLGIKTQPVNKTVKVGATAKFTVTAVGKSLSFQWQYRTSSSGSWKNASATGSKTKTLSVPGILSRNGYQYRCKITDSAGNVIYTSIVKLTVKK